MLAADPVLTEFLASNGGSLRDGFGESSDWIEIANPNVEPLDLAGFTLSDELQLVAKWSFPAGTQVAPNDRIVVFASGRDTTDPLGNLHTNFKLASTGEVVLLASPDGRIVSQFGSVAAPYPPQQTDVSYGLEQQDESIELFGPASAAQLRIPPADELDTAWTQRDFMPAADWDVATAAIGFDRDGGAVQAIPDGVAILQLDINDDDSGEADGANSEAGWASFTLADNGEQFNGVRVTISPIGGVPLDDRDRTTPVDDPPSLTLDQIYDDFVFARSQTDGTGMEVLLEGLVPQETYDVTLWSFDTGSVANRVANWVEASTGEPLEVGLDYTFDGRDSPTSNLDHTLTATLTASSAGTLLLQGTRNGGSSFGVFLNGLQIALPDARSLIESDVGDRMPSDQTSAQLRIPFTVPAGELPQELQLMAFYDSAFVAYLNGQEVARRRLIGLAGQPVPPAATATAERTRAQVLAPELIDLSAFTHLLRPGEENVLAVQAHRSSASDGDFLFRAQLTSLRRGALRERYFTTPTPGAENDGESFAGVVRAPVFNLQRGFYEAPQPLVVSLQTPGAALAVTTDGSVPSKTNGTIVQPEGPQSFAQLQLELDATSTVRAVGLRPDWLPSETQTHSYIFLESVLRQDPQPEQGSPVYPATWQNRRYTADYQIDPRVVSRWDDNNPENDDFGIRDALLSLPTMSIVMDHEDLWGRRGIYPNATAGGTSWRRPASLEYFDPRTGTQMQVNAGVQMHGGASRDNERTKKHSFRLLFKDEYNGPPELEFPLFADSELDKFNTVVLKSFFTDGFPTRTNTGRYSPLDSLYLRDTWMRDARLAMGGLEAHSEYVHLYINGLYWGLYSPTERPDDAFLASYLGGEREDYDVIKDFNELFRGNRSAWNTMMRMARDGLTSAEAYQRIQGNDPDGTPNPALPNYLDVDDLIDYMILHLYAGAEDWPHHNWYAARSREGETSGFRFFTWDQEIVLDGRYRDRTGVSDANTPAFLYSRLRRNTDFQMRFADRVQRHLFNGGALSTERAKEIWMRRADQIEKAIIAESARWGDAREGERHRIDNGGPIVTIPLMTVDIWRRERDRVRDEYFARSHELAISRFQQDNLYPTTAVPVMSSRGGSVASGSALAITGEGTIYYTLDGTDPRQPGGAVSPLAKKYEGPFAITENSTVTVRALIDDEWSAVDQATFSVREPATPGDANRNGIFNSSDLILVFQAGKYERGDLGPATWEEGDFNGDGRFDTEDLLLAFQRGNYSPAAESVPQALQSLFAGDAHFPLDVAVSVSSGGNTPDKLDPALPARWLMDITAAIQDDGTGM